MNATDTAMKLSRDDWMVIGRALQDRANVLENTDGFSAGTLRYSEVERCKALQKLVDAHVDAIWQKIRSAVDDTGPV